MNTHHLAATLADSVDIWRDSREPDKRRFVQQIESEKLVLEQVRFFRLNLEADSLEQSTRRDNFKSEVKRSLKHGLDPSPQSA